MLRGLLVALFGLVAAPAGAAEFLRDTFTAPDGTTLAAHDPEVGNAGSWVIFDSGDAGTIVSNELRAAAAAGRPNYRNTTAPPGAAYGVNATVRFAAADPQFRTYLYGRISGTDRYEVELKGAGDLELFKWVSGVVTSLAVTNVTVTPGASHRLRLQITDASKKVYFDGVEVLSSTDNALTAAGTVGFGVRSDASVSDVVMRELVALELTPLSTAVSGFSATRRGDDVRLRWSVQEPDSISSMQVLREVDGALAAVGAARAPDAIGEIEALDEGAPRDARWWLDVTSNDGHVERIGPAVAAQEPPGCAAGAARGRSAVASALLVSLAVAAVRTRNAKGSAGSRRSPL